MNCSLCIKLRDFFFFLISPQKRRKKKEKKKEKEYDQAYLIDKVWNSGYLACDKLHYAELAEREMSFSSRNR